MTHITYPCDNPTNHRSENAVVRYDSFRHHRRSIRMKGYDYASDGAYFVTVCTQYREPLLVPNPVKRMVQKTWNDLANRFPNIHLDEFVIMPNHVHGIIWIVGAPLGAPQNASTILQGAASSAPTLGRVVRAFKSISAIAANRYLNRTGNPFWQRNFYDRIIRNEDELNHIREYVRTNPENWDRDPENLDGFPAR